MSQKTENYYSKIYSILQYQFNHEVATIFLEKFDKMNIKISKKTHKIKQVFLEGELQASYRPNFGTFTLTLPAIERIREFDKKVLPEIEVMDEISSFIKEGKSVFNKHVINCNENLLIGEEVVIISENQSMLGFGKLNLPPTYIEHFKMGSAVNVRKGMNSI